MASFTFFAAISSDGFLAGPNGDMSWAEAYLATGEDYGFGELMAGSQAVLMGSKTFDFEVAALGDQQRMLQTFVLTHTPMKYDGIADPNLNYLSGPIQQVVAEIGRKISGQVFVVGGADVVNQLVQAKLLNSVTLFVAPDVLGSGTPLFELGVDSALSNFRLENTREYSSGLTQRNYVLN